MQAIYFDMDGTIADLYGVKNWLPNLARGNVYPYLVAEPLVDMEELNEILLQFQEKGVVIGVISWSANYGEPEYNRQVRQVKKMWIDKYLPCVEEFHVVKYGTPKHRVRKIKDSILVDDNAAVRDAWEGETIDATQDIIELLKELL